MYVLTEYKQTINDGNGNTKAEFIRIIDYSTNLDHFGYSEKVKRELKNMGHCKTSKIYNKKYKIILDSNHKNISKNTFLLKLIRNKQISNVLSL